MKAAQGVLAPRGVRALQADRGRRHGLSGPAACPVAEYSRRQANQLVRVTPRLRYSKDFTSCDRSIDVSVLGVNLGGFDAGCCYSHRLGHGTSFESNIDSLGLFGVEHDSLDNCFLEAG